MSQNYLKNTEPRFDVVTKGNVIYVNLSGVWTVQTNLAYLTTLIEHIHNIKGKPWSMFVDMNDWKLPIDVLNSAIKTKILLDRPNQIAESWLVDEIGQAESLMSFFRKSKAKPKQFLDRKEALDWIDKATKNGPGITG